MSEPTPAALVAELIEEAKAASDDCFTTASFDSADTSTRTTLVRAGNALDRLASALERIQGGESDSQKHIVAPPRGSPQRSEPPQLLALSEKATPGGPHLLRTSDRHAVLGWEGGETMDLKWHAAKGDTKLGINAALFVAAVKHVRSLSELPQDGSTPKDPTP